MSDAFWMAFFAFMATLLDIFFTKRNGHKLDKVENKVEADIRRNGHTKG